MSNEMRTANTDPPTCTEQNNYETGERAVALCFRNRAHMMQWSEDLKNEGYVAGLAKGAEAFKARIKSIIKELT